MGTSPEALPHLRLKPRPKYLSLFLIAMAQAIAYRKTTLIRLVANLAWVFIPYYLWRTIFAVNSQVGNFDWERMQTYILLSYAVNTLLLFHTEARILLTIRSGDIATDLMRPIDYLKAQLADASGAATVEGLLSTPIAIFLGIFFLQASLPSSPAMALFFLLSVILGFLVKFIISYMTGLLCFWTHNIVGLLWARAAIANILSGALIPLQFLPGLLKTVALISPFQATIHTPLAIYLGDVQGWMLVQALAVQAGWVVALWLLARLLWEPSLRTLTIQGG